jgi:hypothetical protein
MIRHILITLPLSFPWKTFKEELKKIHDGSEVKNFRVARLPKDVRLYHSSLYVQYEGKIKGYLQITGVKENFEFTCTTTHRKMKGNFIQVSGPFFPLDIPAPTKGFQGWRYYKS